MTHHRIKYKSEFSDPRKQKHARISHRKRQSAEGKLLQVSLRVRVHDGCRDPRTPGADLFTDPRAPRHKWPGGEQLQPAR